MCRQLLVLNYNNCCCTLSEAQKAESVSQELFSDANVCSFVLNDVLMPSQAAVDMVMPLS